MTTTNGASNFVKALILTAAGLFAASCLQQAARTPVPLTSSEIPEPAAVKVSDKAFKEFNHKIDEHKEFECASCHRREGAKLDMEFAAHDSCVGCHFGQFAANDPVICAICHSDLSGTDPGMKDFPKKFNEGWNMKFDHAAHDRGDGRPKEGCVACHLPQGPGKSIPVDFQAHTTCYACHTAESEISSCSVCHELAPYSRTPQSRYVFKSAFSHADHGPRQGVSCNECHTVRAGAPQGRQVTNIVAKQHNVAAGNNCVSCHNGKRAFGDDPISMTTCTRCHSGSGFNMLPGSP